MGAIEALGLTITNAAVTVASGLGEIADAASGEG